MSQRLITLRHNLIINKLRQQKHATFREICGYLERESDLHGENLTISKRTFVRDMAEIGEIYGIYIKYDFSVRSYFIEDDFAEDVQNRRLEALDVFNALKIKERQQKAILLDNRKSTGTEHIYGLLHAINNRLQVTFEYQKFYEEHRTNRRVSPLAIKEFRLRWFLLARDDKDSRIKFFALDRMSALEIQNGAMFKDDSDFNPAEYMKFAFGATVVEGEEPQEVVLSLTPYQGKYIKTLPLHNSQKILVDNDSELRISIKICLTHDFKTEILSLGENVKILGPQRLIDELKAIYKNALEKY